SSGHIKRQDTRAKKPALHQRCGLFLWEKFIHQEKVMRHSRQVMSLLCLMLPVPAVMAQNDADSSTPGFSYNFDVRYRYEQVSQDNALADAEASTVRSRMTLGARPVDGLKLLLEVDNVNTLDPDD